MTEKSGPREAPMNCKALRSPRFPGALGVGGLAAGLVGDEAVGKAGLQF